MSNCFATEGSVLELTSSGFKGSGMLILGADLKDLTGNVVRVGLQQDWVEMRVARDVKVRLVVNILRSGTGTSDIFCT